MVDPGDGHDDLGEREGIDECSQTSQCSLPPPRLQATGREKKPNRHTGGHESTLARTNRHWRARIDTGAHELTHGGDEPAVDRGSGQGPGVNRPPPTCLRTTPHPFVPAPLRTSSRAPTSALLPTPVPHVCRPTSTPVLNRFYLFYSSFFSSPLFYLYLGYPSRHLPSAR